MLSKIADTSCSMAGGPHWNTKLDLTSGQTCASLNNASTAFILCNAYFSLPAQGENNNLDVLRMMFYSTAALLHP